MCKCHGDLVRETKRAALSEPEQEVVADEDTDEDGIIHETERYIIFNKFNKFFIHFVLAYFSFVMLIPFRVEHFLFPFSWYKIG